MNREELTKLAERVEALTGADREVDKIIDGALGWAKTPNPTNAGGLIDMMNGPDGRTIRRTTPAFTASLDAAMSLVPDGCLFMARTLWDGDKTAGSAVVFHYAPTETQGLRYDGQSDAIAATPALALTAAALRARAEVLP
jgi:hypothetical protein